MADDSDFQVEATPSLQQLIEYFVQLLTSPGALGRLETALQNAAQKAATTAKGAEHQAATFTADLLGRFLAGVEEQIEPAVGPFLAKLAGHLVGVDVSLADLRRSAAHGGETPIGNATADIAFKLFAPPEGEIEPGDDGAKRMLATLAQLVFNGWFEATAMEMLVTLFPDMDSFESIAELPHELINALGLSRLARTGLRPLARIAIATPMEWKLNKSHRPNLLSEGEIVKAFNRGDYSGAEAAEELARLGYSDRRQENLIKSNTRRLSLDDVLVLRRAGALDRDYALQNLRDEGYDATTAEFAVSAAESRRLESILDDSLTTITTAYANREITESELRTLMQGVIVDDDEIEHHINTANRRRDFNVRHMSESQVIQCVEAGILSVIDYRAWLVREGYPEFDRDALELLLRARMKKIADVEDERRQLAEEKAAEKAARDKAKQERVAQLEAERALHARGSIADLRRAVARGLIPVARLEEVLQAEYDPDTVTILVDLATQDRADFVAQQQRAEEARQRALRRNIDLGSLEQAVLNHIITVDAYRQAIADRGFDAGDVSILTATLQARLQDLDAAKAKRAKAEQDAAVKHIDLGRLERLVRRGVHTVDEYDGYLQQLGYDEASRAAMDDLLRLEIADDAEARRLRDEAQKQKETKDLNLEQMRRAVLIGVKTDTDFQKYLVAQKYTSDAQAVLVAELRRDVTDADAARRKREAAEAAKADVDLPLSRVTAAARLGLITPDAYRARLVEIGYDDDDIAIEMELLVQEIADTQATRARQQDAEARAHDRGLSLADVAAAVKSGSATIADYQARAIELGYSVEDAGVLASTVSAELDTLTAARARRVTIDGELTARTLSLGELEAAVKAGELTVDDYRAQLEAWGYGAVDAQLLAAVLTDTLAKKTAG